MIKIKRIFLSCFFVLYSFNIAGANDVDKVNQDFKNILSMLSGQNIFLANWDQYLNDNASFSAKDYSGMLTYYMNSFNKALVAYSDQIKKLNTLENNYSKEWLEKLKKIYTSKELKSRKSEIREIIIYLKCENDDKFLLETQKDVLFYGLAYFDLQKEYFHHFIEYYASVPEKQKKENKNTYSFIQTYLEMLESEGFNALIALVGFDDLKPLTRSRILSLKKKDIFDLMNKDDFFKRPFDFMKAIDDLNAL